MKISYKLAEQTYSYTQEQNEEKEKLNFLLTNNKGDFLNLGVEQNVSKFQGLNLCNPQTLEIFKILDAIVLPGLEVKSVETGGYYVSREFGSKISQVMRVPMQNPDKKSEFDEEAVLEYNDNGVLEEVYEEENEIVAQDRFYLGPSGGLVYEIFNYDGNLLIDLDIKKLNDFDEWGRNYNVYTKNGVVLVEYTKIVNEKEDYKVYFAIKAVNFQYDLLKDWVKKDYSYSKMRGSLSARYVYRLMSVRVSESKKLICGFGFSEDEVLEQISLLEMHQGELERFDEAIYNDLTNICNFKTPISQDFLIAYKLSNYSMYNFLNKNLEHGNMKNGSFAGFPWFSNIWARDELVGLRGLINNGEENLVKEKLFDYLNSIDIQTGLLKRIDEKGALQSADGVFWLAKRFEDFISYLEKHKKLNNVLPLGELDLVYSKFYFSFEKIIGTMWDSDNELLKVKDGDSWMDTISVEFPMDIQVQFLELVSFLVVLAQLLRKEEFKVLADFEGLLKNQIRENYFRGGYLYNEKNSDKITSNVFLAYYFYPDLFTKSDWELIIDNTLMHLKTSWGGISSLSCRDSEFKENYTGENNLSYHRGDVWYWINNVAAIAMQDLNDKKYRSYISKILMSSTYDILKMGTIGYASEISSASAQKAEGCFAQLWSVTTYLELIDKIFERE